MEIQASFQSSVSFRDRLQAELISRCRKNPRYSLRAFARSLGLESSYLSKVLLGQRAVTETLVDRLAPQLRLPHETVVAAKQEVAELKQRRSALSQQRKAFQDLSADSFELIASWYHYAILELTQVAHFQSDTKWIAHTLGLEAEIAEEAVARLKRLGFLSEDETGALRCNQNCTTTANKFTNLAFQQLQNELLARAGWAMRSVPIEVRDQSSMTMAIDSRKLPQAKERIAKFRRGLMKYLQGSSKRDSVYQMVISFYPASGPLIPAARTDRSTT